MKIISCERVHKSPQGLNQQTVALIIAISTRDYTINAIYLSLLNMYGVNIQRSL